MLVVGIEVFLSCELSLTTYIYHSQYFLRNRNSLQQIDGTGINKNSHKAKEKDLDDD